MIFIPSEKNKKIGIFGLARTGEATYLALQNIAEVICYDDKEQNRKEFAAKYGIQSLIPLTDAAWTRLDYIILSPGVPTTFPAPHPIIGLAKDHRIPIFSDIDLLYIAQPDAHYIGITGTNGKSTTTALIHHILKDKNYDIGGNIGVPALSMTQSAGYVLELSSFQLDITHKLHVNIAIILNIVPDHLDRHGTFDNYIASKKKLIESLAPNGTVILSIDNNITAKIYQELSDHAKNNNLTLIPISTKKILEHGICVKEGKIFDSLSGTILEYKLPHNKSLQGEHNCENIAAAYGAAIASGLTPQEILPKLENFIGLPHRMQFIGTKFNIDFYNDSKATNADAASKSIVALAHSEQPHIYWLAGGVSKEGGITELQPFFKDIKKAYLFGEAKNLFSQQIGQAIDVQICQNLDEAFNAAVVDAKAATQPASILLAPACASYDQFKDYEQRGEKFIELYSFV